MITFSVREVVEQAVQTEKLGKEFYTQMAEKFRDKAELKKLFELLAAHEIRHGESFLSLGNQLKDEEPEGWGEVTLYLRALVDSEFFLGKDKCLPSLEHVKTAAEAIDFALCFERETLLYYYTLREALKGKEIIDTIIREEKSHIVWLNNLRKSFI
ncbi:MAG: ferritin family protein [Thermodesulfovibrionales bacterium]|jgi:rubrerythrin|nr:ferritin family protein [Thermodesulfovibrionales bacterium]